MRATANSALLLAIVSIAIGCGDDPQRSSFRVSGTVVDFATGQPLESAALETDGLIPAPSITVQGSSFTIEEVPVGSIFQVLAGSVLHRVTYNRALEVTDADLEGIQLAAVSTAYADSLISTYGVTPRSQTAILLARAVDEQFEPRAGVPASAFETPPNATGPYFLDDLLQPAPQATLTSGSGFLLYFDVTPGLISLVAPDNGSFAVTMADSPSSPSAVTLADVVVHTGTISLPVNVSFAATVVPIFEKRGCVSCHDGSGIGKDRGGLHLNGASEKMYKELVQETSPVAGITRVNLANPEQSLVLTMPSREEPPDRHPNVTFASAQDPDYLTLLVWIREGAKNN